MQTTSRSTPAEFAYAAYAVGSAYVGSGVQVDDRERQAIEDYAASDYAGINRLLRRGPSAGHDYGKTAAKIEAMDAVMDRWRAPAPMTVYRGVRPPESGNGPFGSDSMVGKVLTDRGFISTSVERDQAVISNREAGYDREVDPSLVVMEIQVPAGTPGLHVGGALHGLPDGYEEEVILPRGLPMRVVADERGEDGRRRLVMQVDPDAPHDTGKAINTTPAEDEAAAAAREHEARRLAATREAADYARSKPVDPEMVRLPDDDLRAVNTDMQAEITAARRAGERERIPPLLERRNLAMGEISRRDALRANGEDPFEGIDLGEPESAPDVNGSLTPPAPERESYSGATVAAEQTPGRTWASEVKVRDRRELNRQLDEQGVPADSPLRGVIDNRKGSHLAVARDDEGRIVGAAAFRLDRAGRSVVVEDMRVIAERGGHGARLLGAAAKTARNQRFGEQYEMRVHSAVPAAKAFYVRTGAEPFRDGSSTTTWSPEAVEQLSHLGHGGTLVDRMHRRDPYESYYDRAPAEVDELMRTAARERLLEHAVERLRPAELTGLMLRERYAPTDRTQQAVRAEYFRRRRTALNEATGEQRTAMVRSMRDVDLAMFVNDDPTDEVAREAVAETARREARRRARREHVARVDAELATGPPNRAEVSTRLREAREAGILTGDTWRLSSAISDLPPDQQRDALDRAVRGEAVGEPPADYVRPDRRSLPDAQPTPMPEGLSLDLRGWDQLPVHTQYRAARVFSAIDRLHDTDGMPPVHLRTIPWDYSSSVIGGHPSGLFMSGAVHWFRPDEVPSIGDEDADRGLDRVLLSEYSSVDGSGDTVAHEFGHAIDFLGLVKPEDQGRGGALTRSHHQGRDPENELEAAMAEFLAAAKASPSIKQVIANSNLIPNTREYLTDPAEIWARAYAQWVALNSGDDMLVADMRADQRTHTGRTETLPTVWQDDEFEAISAAIEDVLRARGWMR